MGPKYTQEPLRRRQRTREGIVRKTQLAIAGFEGRRGTIASETAQTLGVGKTRKYSFLEPLEGTHPCWHLDFSPGRCFLDLWLPEL